MSTIRKIVLLLLFISAWKGAFAQVDGNLFEGFKIDKRKPDIEIIDIHVLPIGGGVKMFSDGQNKPLDGTYHIIVHRRRYVVCDFKNGIPHGNFEEYLNLTLSQKGTYQEGKTDGKLFRYVYGNLSYESLFHNGVIQERISYFPNGNVEYTYSYDDRGRQHGEFIIYDAEGNPKNEERYEHGKRHGRQVEVRRGARTISHYEQGVLSGEYEAYFPNGNVNEKGTYANGKREGTWIWGREDGSIKSEYNYREGKQHGEQRDFYEDGRLSGFNEYADGKRHGKNIHYTRHPHVISYEADYVNGDYHGEYKRYNDKGELYRLSIYRNGKLIGEKEYREGKVYSVSLINERGVLEKVEEYNSAGRRTYRNTEYRKPATITLKETAGGVIDIEFE